MKKKTSVIIIILLVVIYTLIFTSNTYIIKYVKEFVYSGSVNQVKIGNKEIKSKDGKVSVYVPIIWRKSVIRADSIDIWVCSSLASSQVIVQGFEKNSLGEEFNLSGYTQSDKESFIHSNNITTSTDTEELSLDGHNAEYYEMERKLAGTSLTYMVMNVEAEDKYYKVAATCTAPTDKEQIKAMIKEVMFSFKIME